MIEYVDFDGALLSTVMHRPNPRERKTGFGVGMPAQLALEEFGSQVWNAFGHPPYLVGSALTGRDWRDVDVRLILPDDEYAAMGFGDPRNATSNGKWVAMCWAFSELGKRMTELPIDFQIDQQTYANEKHRGMRSAIGINLALRWHKT